MNKTELYKLTITTYGEEAQINQGIEEMAELIQAVNKVNRDPHYYPYWVNVVEEIVDVEIMLEQYKIIIDISDDMISKFKNQKLYRLADRLGDKVYD